MNRILIVDDEATVREAVAAILSRDGHAVDTAQMGPRPCACSITIRTTWS
jgi:DNA-binding response OmpR family regulator